MYSFLINLLQQSIVSHASCVLSIRCSICVPCRIAAYVEHSFSVLKRLLSGVCLLGSSSQNFETKLDTVVYIKCLSTVLNEVILS